MIRLPVVAGKFYAADVKTLTEEIEQSFKHKLGPKKLPTYKRKGTIKAIISPHAGFMFSGPAAAHVYKSIAEARMPDVFLVIGPNHTGFGASSVTYKDYQTPLGTIKTDTEFAKAIAKGTDLIDDGHAHMNEHSVEVQMPFLQFACKDHPEKLRVVPIVMSGDIDNVKFAKDLKEVIKKSKKKVTIIVSSDMTHFGWDYGYMPFSKDIKNNLYKMDKDTLKLIKESSAEEFIARLDDINGTVCGRWPIALLMNMNISKSIKVLSYYTSGDISKDYTNAVGYAAVLFE